jgi:nitrite reductase/ring-hydroxylating ferredoxin subunit
MVCKEAGPDVMERLCATSDISEGEVRQVTLCDGRVLALYRVAGSVYATDNLCTHGEASLSDGEIEDGQIVCPYHLGKFDIRTGEPTGAPCSIALRTYRVTESDGTIYLCD